MSSSPPDIVLLVDGVPMPIETIHMQSLPTTYGVPVSTITVTAELIFIQKAQPDTAKMLKELEAIKDDLE